MCRKSEESLKACLIHNIIFSMTATSLTKEESPKVAHLSIKSLLIKIDVVCSYQIRRCYHIMDFFSVTSLDIARQIRVTELLKTHKSLIVLRFSIFTVTFDFLSYMLGFPP